MGLVGAVKSFYKRYFDFETRSSRSEYWWVVFFQLIVYTVLFGIMIAGGIASEGSEEPGPLFFVGIIPIALFGLANFIPGIALTVRRFHDQDKSGWMYLLVLIPYIGSVVILIFMLLKGTPGENRFGPDPLGESLADTFS